MKSANRFPAVFHFGVSVDVARTRYLVPLSLPILSKLSYSKYGDIYALCIQHDFTDVSVLDVILGGNYASALYQLNQHLKRELHQLCLLTTFPVFSTRFLSVAKDFNGAAHLQTGNRPVRHSEGRPKRAPRYALAFDPPAALASTGSRSASASRSSR